MRSFLTAIIFFVFCAVPTVQAADLPASILQARPAEAPPLSVPGFAKINAALQEQGTVRVIVRIAAPSGMPHGFVTEQSLKDKAAVTSQRAAIASRQDQVLARISQHHAAAAKRFHFIPFMALEVDSAEFLTLTSSPEIDLIEEDIPVPPALPQSVPLIGGVNGAFNGFSGNGQTVAILDTGVDKNHSFLSGKVVAEACYSTTSGTTSTAVCTDGSTAPGSGLNCDVSIAGCDHGTHVAGIVAGKGDTFSGVAKDATLIAVQVFSQFSAAACGGSPCVMSYTSDQISGLEHVYDLRNTYNISSVNMSLGGGRYYSYCDTEDASEKAAIDTLRSVGIATAIASANNGYTDSIASPACISSAVSVGATDKSDVVASYSNSASFLNLLAPGSSIYSSVPGVNTFAYKSGTSMATPHVAGAWAVLKSAMPKASVSKVLNALLMTGKPITDSRNSIVKPRIQVDAAVKAIQLLPLRADFDGDDKSDIAIWRPSEGVWFIIPTATSTPYTVNYGVAGDKLVPGDYDGDGKTDLAIWRPSNGTWYITKSSDGSQTAKPYGVSTDTPVPGDYDGDGKADLAVWRPSSGIWYITKSSDGSQIAKQFGVSTDIPVPGDYDGDGKIDLAIWRPSTGTWYIIKSSDGSQVVKTYGASTDTPVPGDYDGDGKTDLAVWRPSTGTWYINYSSDGSQVVKTYGASTDTPVPGDYDGDCKTDLAVWRPSTGTWYITNSATGTQTIQQWGSSTDQPVKSGLPIQ